MYHYQSLNHTVASFKMNQTPPSTFHTCLSPLWTLTCYISAPLPRNPEKNRILKSWQFSPQLMQITCLVTGMSSSSLARFLISLGLRPAIFLLMLIMLASLQTLVMSAPLYPSSFLPMDRRSSPSSVFTSFKLICNKDSRAY